MEQRLIDANALHNVFDAMHAIPGGSHLDHLVLLGIKKFINDAPTIEAMPVVHGRWITSSDIPDTLICSACGRRYDMYHFDQKDMPFCLCGAKMDAKEE